MRRNVSELLVSPLFLGALATWAFNDHVLKHVAPGVVSGKLGDAAAMMAFPILLAATTAPVSGRLGLPQRRLLDVCALATAVLFAATKLNDTAANAYRLGLGAAQSLLGWSGASGGAALTMDPTDVLVTPLVLVPMLAVRGCLLPVRVFAPLAATAAVFALSLAGCGATVPRGAWRGDVTVRAHGGATDSSQFGKLGTVAVGVGSDDIAGTHRAGVAGASAEASFRVRRRGVVGGTVSTATGWVRSVDDDYQRFGAYSDRFGVLALGPTFGVYGKRFLITGGLMLVVGGGGGQEVASARVVALPYVRLEPGRPGHVHPILQAGSADGFTWDARALALGLSIPFSRGNLAFGYALGARVGPDLHGTRANPFVFATRHAAPLESYGWLELLARIGEHASLVMALQGGRQLPVASIGLRWNLGSLRSAPPDRTPYHWLPLPPSR